MFVLKSFLYNYSKKVQQISTTEKNSSSFLSASVVIYQSFFAEKRLVVLIFLSNTQLFRLEIDTTITFLTIWEILLHFSLYRGNLFSWVVLSISLVERRLWRVGVKSFSLFIHHSVEKIVHFGWYSFEECVGIWQPAYRSSFCRVYPQQCDCRFANAWLFQA